MGEGSRNLVVIAMAVLVLLPGCEPSRPGGECRIAGASVKSDVCALASLQGTLDGRLNGYRTACLSVGSIALMWPYGYSAAGDPVTVFDDSGVATAGQRVVFAGGFLGGVVHSLLGCGGFTDFWGVGHVEDARWQ